MKRGLLWIVLPPKRAALLYLMFREFVHGLLLGAVLLAALVFVALLVFMGISTFPK